MLRLLFLLVLPQLIVTEDDSLYIWNIILPNADNCLHVCDDKPYGQKVPDPSDCMSYVICQGDTIIFQSCQSGEKFDETAQMCVKGKCPPCNCQNPNTATPTTPTLPTPITPDTYCRNVENGHIFPDETHCRFFWQCVNNKAVLRFCEKGMWWDRDRYVCNFPANVNNCPINQD